MRAVWKFSVPPDAQIDGFDQVMPEGAEIIHAAEQHGQFSFWAIIDSAALKVKRRFRIYGTGEWLNSKSNLKYIGTGQFERGKLVFHLFEEVL